MIKVLTINTSFKKGGAAIIANTLHSNFNSHPELGIKSYFAYGRGNTEDKNSIKITSNIEFLFNAMLMRTFGIGSINVNSGKRLLNLLHSNKFDIIHLHNIHGYYFDLNILKYFEQAKIPIIWTLHDAWIVTGRCAYFGECNRWRHGCGNCSQKGAYPKTWLIDNSKFMYKKKHEMIKTLKKVTFITPSKWLANIVQQDFNKPIFVINNGVDTEIFKRISKDKKQKICRKYDLTPIKTKILFVAANLSDERKGVKYIIDIINNLTTEKLEIITIGKKFPKELINKKIKQLGFIAERKELAQIYGIADIFISTSIDDNFPTTVLESMASGLVVLSFSSGGIPEQINDVGFLFEKGDIKSILSTIRELIKNKKSLLHMQKKSRERAVRLFSLKKFLNNYRKLYEDVIRNKI